VQHHLGVQQTANYHGGTRVKLVAIQGQAVQFAALLHGQEDEVHCIRFHFVVVQVQGSQLAARGEVLGHPLATVGANGAVANVQEFQEPAHGHSAQQEEGPIRTDLVAGDAQATECRCGQGQVFGNGNHVLGSQLAVFQGQTPEGVLHQERTQHGGNLLRVQAETHSQDPSGFQAPQSKRLVHSVGDQGKVVLGQATVGHVESAQGPADQEELSQDTHIVVAEGRSWGSGKY